jgi:competence/damage-inducible protein CinA-like protein
MPSAELITIGTELLLGEIQDTNTRYLAKKLKGVNIDLFRITMVGDNIQRIADLVKEALLRSGIVITTGGLGPTVDDPTRDAIALAFNTQTEFHPELWQEIEQRFLQRLIVPTENNRRQAYLPIGSEVIHNPVGTAPAFYLISGDKILICLPGVPKEMETLMETAVLPLLKRKYNLQGIIKAHVIHLAGIGESVVDSAIGDFERLSNPTVGLLAHPGIVDVRITAKANSIDEADAMIAQIEEKIVAAFPKQIFGFDEETLLKAVVTLAKEKKATVDISSFGLEEYWPEEVNTFAETQLLINNLAQPQKRLQTKYSQRKKATIQVDCIFEQINEESKVTFNILTQGDNRQFVNLYNGPCAQGASWAINILFETIRQTLLELE